MGELKIPFCEHVSRRQAITDVIESIAMEEKGIAAILDVEVKKINTVLCSHKPSISDLQVVDKSVCDCIKALVRLQLLLGIKLEEVSDLIDDSDY